MIVGQCSQISRLLTVLIPNKPIEGSGSLDFSNIKRPIVYFNNINGTLAELRNLDYFSPWGIDTIYLSFLNSNGSSIKLYDLNNNLIFDSTEIADTGRQYYKVRTFLSRSSNNVRTIKYDIEKVNRVN